MTSHILAVYDRSALGDLAVETGFRVAGQHHGADLYVIAVPTNLAGSSGAEQLADDLLAFARLAQRAGIALDGSVLDSPTVDGFVDQIRSLSIDHLIIAKPLIRGESSALSDMLEGVAAVVDIPTTVVHEQTA